MKNLFGTGFNASQKKVDSTEVSSSINARLDSLNKSINECDDELFKYKLQGKQSRGGAVSAATKRRALDILKRKRMYEQQRDAVYNQQFNLDQANFSKEQMQANLATVSALKETTKAMKVQMRRTDIGSIEKMQDQMLDLMDDQNELSEILSRNYTIPDISETELDDEFASLMEEESAEPIAAAAGGKSSSDSYLLDAVNAIPSAPPMPQHEASSVGISK